jgi:hypothetical protein
MWRRKRSELYSQFDCYSTSDDEYFFYDIKSPTKRDVVHEALSSYREYPDVFGVGIDKFCNYKQGVSFNLESPNENIKVFYHSYILLCDDIDVLELRSDICDFFNGFSKNALAKPEIGGGVMCKNWADIFTNDGRLALKIRWEYILTSSDLFFIGYD